MYKETVSPARDTFINILNQIPEKKTVPMSSQTHDISNTPRRAMRSPYIWISVAEFVTLCSLLFAVYPTYKDIRQYSDNPFYQVDQEVSQFEATIDEEDLQIVDQDATLI